MSKKAAYEITYTSSSSANLDPGLYFDVAPVMEVVEEHLPGFVDLLTGLKEEMRAKVRDSHDHNPLANEGILRCSAKGEEGCRGHSCFNILLDSSSVYIYKQTSWLNHYCNRNYRKWWLDIDVADSVVWFIRSRPRTNILFAGSLWLSRLPGAHG